MGLDSKIKVGVGVVGVVGAGFMCRSHSNAYHKIRYMYWSRNFLPVMAGVADITKEGADEAAERYGYVYGCKGWEPLLADPAIGLIDVCVGGALQRKN
jgi:predicted dehydrogenase